MKRVGRTGSVLRVYETFGGLSQSSLPHEAREFRGGMFIFD